jgi:poly(3-hydroxyalkanoate) synthetase
MQYQMAISRYAILLSAKLLNGSWWNSWNKWLSANSGKLTKSIDYNSLPMIEPAPGSYVK